MSVSKNSVYQRSLIAYFTPQQFHRLKHLAMLAGCQMSAFVRQLLDDDTALEFALKRNQEVLKNLYESPKTN